ncbi:hypothetical protein AN639_10130 [Candidatus Epulonipiscium fishelsonii]|uniref:Uncharacterized protein n=1 Tax=Candidatus Epulonipiscium fishelsonii TaxID=77094 RepID=A0ACC8X8K9_9FIRM|nr:hypothetical protein AN396_11210 [Epulopiscium sp. SCG-B11WGA-EpuloA1]ONI43679.1 hypothetical protein AN639_10130 [Epulopiscium sp. SCG-B05WGA-EpuloA1]
MSMSYIAYLNLYSKPVSVIIDEKIIVHKLLPNEFLSYKKIDEGYHFINVHQEDTSDLLYTKKVNIKPNSSFTFIIYDNQDVKCRLIAEGGLPLEREKCFIKIGNFATNFNNISLVCKDNVDEPIYSHKLEYETMSSYITSSPDKFQLIIQDEANQEHIINLPKFKPYRYYSFYIINTNNSKKYDIIKNIDMVSYKKLDHIN